MRIVSTIITVLGTIGDMGGRDWPARTREIPNTGSLRFEPMTMGDWTLNYHGSFRPGAVRRSPFAPPSVQLWHGCHTARAKDTYPPSPPLVLPTASPSPLAPDARRDLSALTRSLVNQRAAWHRKAKTSLPASVQPLPALYTSCCPDGGLEFLPTGRFPSCAAAPPAASSGVRRFESLGPDFEESGTGAFVFQVRPLVGRWCNLVRGTTP